MDPRLLAATLGGNLGGALLTFAYFRFLDPLALQGAAPVGAAEIAYFVAGFSLLSVIGRFALGRWAGPVLRRQGALPAGMAEQHLRRRALQIPTAFALMSFSGWIAAALIWGVLWPLLTDAFVPVRAARQAFGIIFVAGVAVAVFVFLATERVWRERLPQLFPAGDLDAAGAPRLRVRSRLVILFLLVGILPMAVLSVATSVRAIGMLGADAQSFASMIRNLITVQAVLVAAGLLMALALARYVASSVAQPLAALQVAMAQVGQGHLEVSCPVVSNDELGSVAEGFNRMVAGLREREAMREVFGKYVSPQVRDEILAGRASLAGSQREVTVLFADLRDFTPWVESTPASEVVAALNAYFSEMDSAIRSHGGLVLQFIGDEIEAVFGAPLAQPQHADQAVAAALDMQARLAAWNAARRARGKVELHHGIGIHSGSVVAGAIGGSERMSYALVGDTVNLASRIQALNKQFGTRILLSGATRAQLTRAPTLRALPAVHVKGRAAEVEVFAVS